MLCGQARHASEERRKAAERLLDMGDRYRGMSMLDLVDECNRIEGRDAQTYDPEERVRAAFSGSALSAIFTQNVSAQFLGGYLDAADTTQGWVTESDVPNFLQNERAIYGKMGQLERLGKGGTANGPGHRDWNEVYKIFRYAGQVRHRRTGLHQRPLRRPGADEPAGHGPLGPPDPGQPGLRHLAAEPHPEPGQPGGLQFGRRGQPLGGQQLVTGADHRLQRDHADGQRRPAAGRPSRPWASSGSANRVLEPAAAVRHGRQRPGVGPEHPLKSQQRIITSGSGGTYNPLAAAGIDMETRLEGRLDPLGCYNNDEQEDLLPVHHHGHARTGHSGTCILAARPGRTGRQDGRSRLPHRHGPGAADPLSHPPRGIGQYGMAWDVNLDIGVQILDFRGLVLITGGGTQLAATGPAQS